MHTFAIWVWCQNPIIIKILTKMSNEESRHTPLYFWWSTSLFLVLLMALPVHCNFNSINSFSSLSFWGWWRLFRTWQFCQINAHSILYHYLYFDHTYTSFYVGIIAPCSISLTINGCLIFSITWVSPACIDICHKYFSNSKHELYVK